MRRRNGKRGKGMATKKEKTKEQRIKTEKTRLKGIFKDLDENKRKLVTPLIEKAAFMSIELDDLQAKLEKDGWTSEYQNGQNQWVTKKSPEAETCSPVMSATQADVSSTNRRKAAISAIGPCRVSRLRVCRT